MEGVLDAANVNEFLDSEKETGSLPTLEELLSLMKTEESALKNTAVVAGYSSGYHVYHASYTSYSSGPS